ALRPLLALLVLISLGLDLVRLFGLFGFGRGLDLRFDLVAEVDFAARVLLVLSEVVLLAEIAQLLGADLQLVGDPCIGPPLLHPGADLVELRLQRATSHRRASLLKEGIRLRRGGGGAMTSGTRAPRTSPARRRPRSPSSRPR